MRQPMMRPGEKTTTWMLLIPGAAVVCLVFISLPFLIKTFIVQAFKTPTRSMSPTLMVGDQFFTDKSVRKLDRIQRGDVVKFAFPRDPRMIFVKRAIGLPGDLIEIKNKSLYINGDAVKESYAIHEDERTYPASAAPRDNFGPLRVPENSLFVLGDNRDASNDSRFWGCVPSNHLKGRATRIYWSWDHKDIKVRWRRIGLAVH